MMQVQVNIDVRGEGKNTITVNLFEREDVNDLEREMAHNIQEMLLGVMEMVRDELPPGEVDIHIIEKETTP